MSLYFSLTLITDRQHPAADQVDQSGSLETDLRSENMYFSLIFCFNGRDAEKLKLDVCVSGT